MANTDAIGTLLRLTDSLQAQVPGVLYPVVRLAVWDAVEDFCIRSGYWRKSVSWTLPAGTPSVQLVSGESDAVIQRVVEVYGLTPYRIQQPDTLVYLGSNPPASSGTALLALKPTSLDNTPAFILQTWYEVLLQGATMRLFSEPAKPYSNPEVAQTFGERFEAGIARAQLDAQVLVGAGPLGPDPDLDRLYTNVQVEIPAANHALVQLAAWNTVEEFYLRSTARREHAFWQMPSGVYAVDFNPFDGDWLVGWVLGYTGLTYGKIEPPALLRDIQSPQSSSLRQGEALLALKPASFTSDFGPYIWQQWFETVLDGTLWRLYRQPEKPWSSPQLAMQHGQMFRAGINRARAIADRDLTNSGGRWRFPYFAQGRRKN